MTKLERLSKALTTIEREGTQAELSEAGTLARAFLQRRPVDTLDHDNQVRLLLDASARKNWALVRKLTHSPFSDVARTAAATIEATFGRQ